MNKLPHVIVDIVTEENVVGGILVPALINRVQARFAAEKQPVPAFDAIKECVFELMTAESITVSADRRVRLVKSPVNAKPPIWSSSTKNPSGIYPIGIGDFLFNAAGEPVAEVVHMRKANGAVEIEVRAAFRDFRAYDGTHIPRSGEILSGVKDMADGPLYSYKKITARSKYRKAISEYRKAILDEWEP